MEIHIYAQLEESFDLVGLENKTISVREIIEKSGPYSGLTLRVKHLISPVTDNWKSCQLKLQRGVRPGWFIIVSIIHESSVDHDW